MSEIRKDRPLTLTVTDKSAYEPHPSRNCMDSIHFDTIDGRARDVEMEMSALVEKLVEEDRIAFQKNTEVDKRHPVLLLAICGMGGIGKSSIARKIFDDQRIRSAFSTCLWVSIPKGFTHTDVLSETIHAAGGVLKGSETINERRRLLAKLVKGKRIFLVLNGTTSLRNVHPAMEDAEMHSNLIDTLIVLCLHAEGSRVLMTARDEDGAVKLFHKHRTLKERLVVQIHRIPQLTVEHGWMLLRKAACLDQPRIVEDAPEIEITIVKKCNGLPLAIKIVGGVLRRKSCTLDVWKSVRDNEAFTFKDLPEGTAGIMGSICLSYQDALPHVKQCLLYLSLFPVGFVINQHQATQMWISEGLLDTRCEYSTETMVHGDSNISSSVENQQNNANALGSNQNIRLPPQTANGCNDFSPYIQEVNTNQSSESTSEEIANDQRGHPSTGAMGVHDSPSSVGIADKYNSGSLEEMADTYFKELVERNLLQQRQDMKGYMLHERVWSFAQFLTKDEVRVCDGNHIDELPTNLRHISFLNTGLTSIPGDIVRLRSLRTLLLSGNPLSEDGLDIIFRNLKFLRVLDLTNTDVKSIPKSLGNLVQLRHLDVSQTRIRGLPESIDRLWRLRFLGLRKCEKLISLPVNIAKLRKLEYLNLRDTKIPKTPPRLQDSKHLTFLHGFIVVGKSSYGWGFLELEGMRKLRNLHLEIKKDVDTDREVLKNMPNLRSLELCCAIGDSEDSEVLREKLETTFTKLHPHPCLQSLKIDGYCGSAYPEWLSAMELANLQQLNLLNCKFCENLPLLSQFRKLKVLNLTGISKLQTIDMQGTAGTMSFLNLEELQIVDMQNLESWSAFEAGGLPLLQKLSLINCPKLKLLPGGLEHCKMLTTMEVRSAELLQIVENLMSLKELVIEAMPSISKLSNLPLLKVLKIIGCSNLEQVLGVNSLRHIHMEDEQLVQLPKWLEYHASKIETLDIVGKVELLHRCERNMDDWYIIREIAHVYAYLPERLSFFLYTRSNDFFCRHQTQRSQAHDGPSKPPAGVEKRSSVAASSSMTNSRANIGPPLRPVQTHEDRRSDLVWRYAAALITSSVLSALVPLFFTNASDRDPWEAFYVFCLFFITVVSLLFFVRLH